MVNKSANNTNIFVVENYDYDTFKKIATSKQFIDNFEGKIWHTNSTQKLKTNFSKISKGAIKFDFTKPFEFYDYYTLEKKIKERTELFEEINWQTVNQIQFQSAKELHLWEVWLEQIKYIDLRFVEAVL